MRELKFRAWDGKTVRYDATGFEHGDNNEMLGVFLNGDYYSIVDRVECKLGTQAIVMQYTGVKDKNGADIYEKDVISLDNRETFVGFDWRGCGYFLECGTPIADFCNIEVAGNIYENTELLEKKNEN